MEKKLVWAKLRYCKYWPAQIVDKPPPSMEPVPRKKNLCIFFWFPQFVSNFLSACFIQFFYINCYHNLIFYSSANVPKENIKEYTINRSKYIKKGRDKKFNAGIQELESLLNDSSVSYVKNYKFFSFFGHKCSLFLQSDNDEQVPTTTIQVKEERASVKIEPNEAISDNIFVEVRTQSWVPNEKTTNQKIIDELVTANTENQQLYFNLQKNRKRCIELEIQLESLESEIICLKLELNKSRSSESDLK